MVVRLGKDEAVGGAVNLVLEAFPSGDPSAAVAAAFDPSPALGYLAFTAKEAVDADVGADGDPILPEEVNLQAHENNPMPQMETGNGKEGVKYQSDPTRHEICSCHSCT